MPALSLQTEACVLLKRPPAEKFQVYTLFAAGHGLLTVLQRLASKPNPAAPALDLFDEATLTLHSGNQGNTWFVHEAQIQVHRAGIARSYETLLRATAIASLVCRNPLAPESRPAVAHRLRQSLDALAAGHPPDLVYLKMLYAFARDEGYPVQQQWLAELAPAWRATAGQLLHTPLAQLAATPAAAAELGPLLRRLEDYLRGYTELFLD